MIAIWHNPRCSKSRQTLALLQERGLDPQIRLYLQDPPSLEELRGVLIRLGLPARAMIRTGEATFRDLGLSASDADDRLLAGMANHPILIERPIVLNGDRAAIGRPPEAVLDIL